MPRRDGAPAQSPWIVLAILWAVYVIHGIDRSVLLVLLEPIRKTFSLNDSQIGLLTGLGYAAPFALAGIPLGAISDRVRSRKAYLAILIALWSVLTAAGGLATGFLMLLFTRACVGAAEAGAPPTMLSLLGDTFDPRVRPAALSVYFTAPFAGIMAGSIFAGDISGAHGWRVAVLAIGLPGLLAALLVVSLLREPKRGRFNAPGGQSPGGQPHAAAPIGTALLYAVRNGNVLRLLLALILAAFVTLAILGWVPVLMERVFGLTQQRTGGLTALVIGLPSIIGSLAAGALAARFGRGRASWLLLICGIAMLVAACLGTAALLTAAPRTALFLLATWSFAASIYTGSAWSVFTGAIPPAMRGTVTALGVVLVNLIGAGLGPQFVGLLSDALHRGHDQASLQHAMAAAALVNLVTGMLFLSSRKIGGSAPQ